MPTPVPGDPAKWNFTIRQGKTFRRRMWWRDEDGVLYDLSDHEGRLQARRSLDAEDPILDWVSGSEITLGSGAAEAPNIIIEASAAATAALDWDGLLYHDFEVESPSGIVVPVAEGRVTLKLEVAREAVP